MVVPGSTCALNLKMDEVKYSTVQSANSEYISNVGGYICKQGNVCYMAVSFTILKTRDIGSLFKFSDYLAPKGASVIGHIYNNNTEAVCGFLFPTKAHANYNNGFIRNQASLSPGVSVIRSVVIVDEFAETYRLARPISYTPPVLVNSGGSDEELPLITYRSMSL